MLDLSSLDLFASLSDSDTRRGFLRSTAAAGLLPFGISIGGKKASDGLPVCPLKPIYEDRFDSLVSIVRAQVDSLWCGQAGDDACEIAREVLVYAGYLPRRLQHGLSIALLWLDLYSVKHLHRTLGKAPPSQVRRLLNQGETRRRSSDPPLIRWEEDYLLHTAVAGIAMIGRLVIHSRPAARELVHFSWSEKCEDMDRIVGVDPYSQADLSTHYDVCIIGSGAGGATVANRLSAAGLRVLILDVGDFVSPDALIQTRTDENGRECLMPPRSDEVLYRLYKDAAGQIAGGLSNSESKLDLVLPNRRKKIRPKQTVNVLQAEVFGGGPYVNNAIHLPIPQAVYESWGERQVDGVGYDQIVDIMNSINRSLGVNRMVTDTMVSDRSLRFKKGCERLGEVCEPLPVAIRQNCLGCGSDNSVDSFGDHVGGVHPYRAGEPASFLTQAIHNPTPTVVSYRTRASRVRLVRDETGCLTAAGVDVVHRDESGCATKATVTADQYVLAAGVGASTQLATNTLRSAGCSNSKIGKRLTANIGTALYAMFDKPIWPSDTGQPEPGVTQCYLVDRRMIEENGEIVEEPALENWFHFPGTVALALTGWFKEFACVMKKFNHLSMSGIVIPTHVRCSNYVEPCGKFHLEYDRDEFEFLLRGMRRVARIYFAAADPDDGVTLYLPTKSILMRGGCPAVIRNMDDFEWALCQIRKRGPAFLNLLSTHPQGGNALGDVVDTDGFRLMTGDGQVVDNLMIADASVFPAGCEINPQLTVKALATIAADRLLQRRVG